MFVSIVMPCLNEANWIEHSVRSISSSAAKFAHEIIVADGGSTDGTLDILAELRKSVPNLRVLHNPKRLQSAGVNLGVEASDPRATIVIRADCHAHYPADFVPQCVRSMIESRAASVVVPMIAAGEGTMQTAVAAAQNSLFGNGGAPHRNRGNARFVEHGHHAAFSKAFFSQVGGYDPTFSHNEDAELDVRIRAAGGRIWMNPDAAIDYLPRDNFPALARQYFNHGRGRARTIVTHGTRPKIRQLMPLVATAAIVTGIALGLVWPPAFLLPLAYAAVMLAVAMKEVADSGHLSRLLIAPILATIHVSWAIGFVNGVLRYSRKRPEPYQGQLKTQFGALI